MNLKTAARQLGVHYQTAYRWVRQGELVAVKVGTTYEVSSAAIEQFRALRSAARTYPLPLASGVVDEAAASQDPCGEALLARLVAVAEQSGPSTVALEDDAVRDLARHLDAFTILWVLDDERDVLVGSTFHHSDPCRRALLGSFMTDMPASAEGSIAGQCLHGGGTVRIVNFPQDRLRENLEPSARQILDRVRMTQLVQVPLVADGVRRGVLEAFRGDTRSFTDDETEVVEAIAALLGEARARAERFVRSRGLRDRLVAELSAGMACDGEDAAVDRARELLDGADAIAAVTDQHADARFVVATSAFARGLGTRAQCLLGHPAPEAADGPLLPELAGSYERLRSGELDYVSCAMPSPDGRRTIDVHCGVVRRPDASTAFVVTTASPGLTRVPSPRTPCERRRQG